MSHFDAARARALMEERRLDALCALSRANVYYTSGFLNYFYKPGAAMVLYPADAARPPAMIISSWEEVPARRNTAIQDIRTFRLWMEIDAVEALERGTTQEVPKPVQFDLEGNIRLLGDILRERRLDRARLGLELGSTPLKIVSLLEKECPQLELIEAEDVFYALRAIKTKEEVRLIEDATRLIERGMEAVAGCGLVGASVSKIRLTYQRAIADAALSEPAFEGLSGFRVTTSIGGDFAPKAASDGSRAAAGDMVFFDSSVYLSAYASDTGRTFTLGAPKPLARRVLDALHAGVAEALAIAKPGLPFAELFNRTQKTIRRHGLPTFTRGHMGHTIGVTHVALDEEQPPFVSPDETAVLEPGMVFCFEPPYYVHGLGGFQIEEVLEVTETGVRRLTTLPMDFWRIEV